MQPNPPKSSRKATSRPPHAKTHSTPAPNSSTNQTRHAFFSSLLEHIAVNRNHLTGSPGPVGRRGLQVDTGYRPKTATPPRGLEGRPAVALLRHWAALRSLPDVPHRATPRAYPNGIVAPSNYTD